MESVRTYWWHGTVFSLGIYRGRKVHAQIVFVRDRNLRAVQGCTVLYCTALCCAVLCCNTTQQHSTSQHNIICRSCADVLGKTGIVALVPGHDYFVLKGIFLDHRTDFDASVHRQCVINEMILRIHIILKALIYISKSTQLFIKWYELKLLKMWSLQYF